MRSLLSQITPFTILHRYMCGKTGADLVFATSSEEHAHHISTELEQLGKHFGKNLNNGGTDHSSSAGGNGVHSRWSSPAAADGDYVPVLKRKRYILI